MDETLQLCIQELIEVVSTPNLPCRCLLRGLLALLRVGAAAGPMFSAPGLAGVIALALR